MKDVKIKSKYIIECVFDKEKILTIFHNRIFFHFIALNLTMFHNISE